MRPIIKLLRRAVILLVIIFAIVYLFLVFQGRAIFIKQLEEATQKKVSIGYFSIVPPLNIEVRNLDIEGLLKAESLSISPSLIGSLSGRLVLNNIRVTKPELTYEKNPPSAAGLTSRGTSGAATAASPKKKPPFAVIFNRLSIKDGKINFIDHTVGTQGIRITLKEINFSLHNAFAFPASVITEFELKGKIPWKEGQEEGRIEAKGWLDFIKKDMQATLKIEDIDGIYLYPYYSTWVDLEKARIEKAKLNFSSDIKGTNNNVTADCHLELTDIVRKERPPEEEEQKAEKIASAVLDIFRALNQGKIVLNFTIRTRMDRPEFGFGNIKMAFENKVAEVKSSMGFKTKDVLMFPTKLIEGTVKKTTDLSKAVIDGTFTLGKEFVSAIEAAFKKGPK